MFQPVYDLPIYEYENMLRHVAEHTRVRNMGPEYNNCHRDHRFWGMLLNKKVQSEGSKIQPLQLLSTQNKEVLVIRIQFGVSLEHNEEPDGVVLVVIQGF